MAITPLTFGASIFAVGHVAPMVAGLFGLLIFFLLLGAMGLFEAWRKKRGVLGWIVSYLIALVGGVSGFLLLVGVEMLMERILKQDGPPSDGMILVAFVAALLGSWIAPWIASRFR